MEQRYTDTRSAKGEGVAAGCLAGWGLSGCMLFAGVILCFTGIGAIIGVPLLLAAFLMPVIGPLMGLTNIKGPCPYCGSEFSAQPRATNPASTARLARSGSPSETSGS